MGKGVFQTPRFKVVGSWSQGRGLDMNWAFRLCDSGLSASARLYIC